MNHQPFLFAGTTSRANGGKLVGFGMDPYARTLYIFD